MKLEIPIFVISLPNEHNRRSFIEASFAQKKIKFSFFDAYDGKKLPEAKIKEILSEKNILDSVGRFFSKGEIGCCLSHLGIYKKMIEENIDLAVIFEDDIEIISDHFFAILKKISDKNNHDPKVTLLTQVISYLSKKNHHIFDNFETCYMVQAYSAAGYIINLQAAKQMLKTNQPIWILADDWQKYRKEAKVEIECLVPHIIAEHEIAKNSSIVPKRKQLKKIRSLRYRISRFINKGLLELKKIFLYKPFMGYKKN